MLITRRNTLIALACVMVTTYVLSTTFFGTVSAQKIDSDKSEAVQPESPSAVFTNSTAITVGTTASNAAPYPSAISVSGLTGTIANTNTSVKVTLNNFSHSFPDDLGVVLVAPNGEALLLMDGAGDDPDMAGVTFTFSDSGATQLPDLTAWAAGTYKPTAHYTGDSFPAPGPLLAYGHPGPAVGGGTATFQSVYAGDAPNGTWNLFVRDFASGDSGSIAGGWSLEITTTGGGSTADVPADMNGDHKSDFVLVRNTGGGPSGQMTWFVQDNQTGGFYNQAWGLNGDAFVPADYDGDGKDDIAVWRPGATAGAQARFFIIQSGTFTIRQSDFGLTGDDPSVVGDYDGNGTDDIAVYRAGATSGAASSYFWRANDSALITQVVHGQNGDFPAPGDYDGDGKQDYVQQRLAAGNTADFIIKFNAGGADSTINFGTATDVIVPGDYDGDGKTDIAVVRGSGGFLTWSFRRSIDGATVNDVWGQSATDFPTPGDYNGDGKWDYAVYRQGAQGTFHTMTPVTRLINSRDWGLNGDYPVANYNVH